MRTLRDLNDDSDRLGGRSLRGLGRLLDDNNQPTDYGTTAFQPVASGGGEPVLEYTPYEEVTTQATPAQTTIQTFTPATTGSTTGTVALPQFNFNTGVATCSNSSSGVPVSNAVAAESTVKPLPEAPKTINWLLLGLAGGLAFLMLREGKGPLNGLEPEPVPEVEEVHDLGRAPKRKPAKPRHVATLSIS